MQNRSSLELFAIIKGMSKTEKKYFQLFAKRNSGKDQLKVLTVYRAINTMKRYDEQKLVTRLKNVQPTQVPNLKAGLYKLLLDSLRLIHKEQNIHLQLHQLMDHAKILYGRGFIPAALKTLRRIKILSLHYHQLSFAYLAVGMEKKIELAHGNCEPAKIHQLNSEWNEYAHLLTLMAQTSDVAMILFGFFKRYGSIRNQEDEISIHQTYGQCLQFNRSSLSFYPQLYLAQAKAYYHAVKEEYVLFHEAAKEWTCLFNRYAEMKEPEAVQYHKALFCLAESSLLVKDEDQLRECAHQLKSSEDPFYGVAAQLNQLLLKNEYDKELVKEAASLVKTTMDPERFILLSYKAAQLCIHTKQFEKAIDFTHGAISRKSNARFDLQYRLRLMNIEAHKKLGNHEIIESLERSTKRFVIKYQLQPKNKQIAINRQPPANS